MSATTVSVGSRCSVYASYLVTFPGAIGELLQPVREEGVGPSLPFRKIASVFLGRSARVLVGINAGRIQVTKDSSSLINGVANEHSGVAHTLRRRPGSSLYLSSTAYGAKKEPRPEFRHCLWYHGAARMSVMHDEANSQNEGTRDTRNITPPHTVRCKTRATPSALLVLVENESATTHLFKDVVQPSPPHRRLLYAR